MPICQSAVWSNFTGMVSSPRTASLCIFQRVVASSSFLAYLPEVAGTAEILSLIEDSRAMRRSYSLLPSSISKNQQPFSESNEGGQPIKIGMKSSESTETFSFSSSSRWRNNTTFFNGFLLPLSFVVAILEKTNCRWFARLALKGVIFFEGVSVRYSPISLAASDRFPCSRSHILKYSANMVCRAICVFESLIFLPERLVSPSHLLSMR